MRVLILGCGYVGLPLGAALAGAGNEVFGLRRTASDAADLEAKAAGIKLLAGDITKPDDLARLPAGCDWVIHCVSASGGGPEAYRSVYLEGTRRLLAWLAGRPPARFVYTSSTSVYGQNDGSVVDENSPAEPLDAKARILVETENALLRATQENGFPAIILRLAGIYGPGRGYWFKQFLSGQAQMQGDGSRILNMIHRADAAGAIVAALECGRPGQIYNVVDDEPVTQLRFFEWLSGATGRPLPPAAAEPEAAFNRAPTNKKVSSRKLKAELGYRFKLPTFREGYEAEFAVTVSMRAAMRAERRAESEGE